MCVGIPFIAAQLKTSSASGPSSIIEDFNGPRDEVTGLLKQGHGLTT